MNRLNHDLEISPIQSLFRFSNHWSDDTLCVCLWIDHFVWYQIINVSVWKNYDLTCNLFISFCIFIAMMQCFEIWKNRLVQSIERGTTQFTNWFDSGYIVVWLKRDWIGLNQKYLFFLLIWSSNTTMTESVESWLKNITNSISVQVFKSLQWWHYFNYSEYSYLWKL